MANERAETSLLSDADPIYHGPSKYASLQLRWKAAPFVLIVQVREIEICNNG